MPELSQDPFGEAMARASFFLMEGSSMHPHFDQNPQQSSFLAPENGPMMYKPVHYGQEGQKFPGMSTHSSFVDPDLFMRPACFLPVESELSKLQHTVGGYSPYVLQNYQPPQLEVPEIDESSTWMSDVLDDFPAISNQELSPVVASAGNVSFGLIPPPIFSPSVTLPLTARPEPAEESAVTPPRPTTSSPPTGPIQGVEPSALASDVTSVSHTPKPLKRYRRQRGPEKAKKVANVEQLEHVRRERQRRDDMSFKISTLERLLPPAGPNLKRDRASIVHDSVHYLKSLQEQVEELKKKLVDLKLTKSTRRPALARSDHVKATNPETATSGSKVQQVEYHIQVEGEDEPAARLEKCTCRPDYMSRAMKVFEQLNLDVRRCTITKMCDHTFCVIIAKPRLTSSKVVSASSVVTAIRSSIKL